MLSLCLVFILGISLVILSIWVGPYDEARETLEQGELEDSLVLYAEVEQRFDALTITRQLFPDVYADSIASQFYILYYLEKYDDLLEKSATSPVLPEVHFWTGNALFRRAGGLTDAQEQIAWLERAGQE